MRAGAGRAGPWQFGCTELERGEGRGEDGGFRDLVVWIHPLRQQPVCARSESRPGDPSHGQISGSRTGTRVDPSHGCADGVEILVKIRVTDQRSESRTKDTEHGPEIWVTDGRVTYRRAREAETAGESQRAQRGHTRTHARTHTRARAHACTHARTPASARARTHTHAHAHLLSLSHTHTSARTHEGTHARTRAPTHTHAHRQMHTHTRGPRPVASWRSSSAPRSHTHTRMRSSLTHTSLTRWPP